MSALSLASAGNRHCLPTDDPSVIAAQISKKLCGPGLNSANRLSALLALTASEGPDVFWDVFHKLWSNCDNTWSLQEDVLDALEWFGQDGDYMTDEQQAYLSGLNADRYSRVTVYRGCSRARIHGLSWTTNPTVAQEFARGHRGITLPDPVVVKAKIRKSSVITAILDREEDEIILDPRHLTCLRETNLPPAISSRATQSTLEHQNLNLTAGALY